MNPNLTADMMKRITMINIYIDTMGCPKNQEDSERTAGLLKSKGHTIVFSPEDADVMVINTCGFIDDAKRESIDRILELAQYKDISKSKKLIVTGCLSQRYGDELYKEFKEVDAIMGVNDYSELPNIIEGLLEKNDAERILKIDGDEGFLEGDRVLLHTNHTAYLKIAEGCSNHCSYCVIPSIRGPYRSVKKEDVINDATKLVENGAKELVLIAQDVSAWGIDLYGKYALPELLKELVKIHGVQWIRLLYCYEERITDELIETIASEDKICKYIDIPLQHVSANILEAMNRTSRPKQIKATIEKLRTQVPGIAIRTTFITGFPGEMEEDFGSLKKFIENARFDRLGVFTYSREEGTEAANMKEQIPHEIASDRRDDLMRIQMDIAFEKNEAMVGKIYDVLIDDIEENEEGGFICYGRTQYDAPEIDNGVIINSDKKLNVGDMLKVKITEAYDYDLIGEVVE